MATVNLLPSSTHSNDWSIAGGFGVTAHLAANTDDGDTKYLNCDTTGKEVVFHLDNLDSDGLNIDTIDSVQVVLKSRIHDRAQTYTIRTQLQDSLGAALYTEDVSDGSSGTYDTLMGTARTTSDGSTAWSDSAIDGLRLLLNSHALSGGTLRMTYCYVIVTYTPVGYTNDVMGVDSGDIATINGIATANIGKVNGI